MHGSPSQVRPASLSYLDCRIRGDPPVRKGLQLILLGMMGRTPFAGVAWQVLHYLEGFRRLGCDVYYVEDTGDWPYDPEQNTVTADCDYTPNYISRLMDWCGLSERWAYCSAATGSIYGLTDVQLTRVFG